MAIVECVREDGSKCYKYTGPQSNKLYETLSIVLDALECYVNKTGDLNFADIEVDPILLTESFVRIDKRKDYFIIFHDDTDMNEIKETALLIYWLLKFRPFKVKEANILMHKKYRHINEAFSLFLIYSVLKQESVCHKNVIFHISKEYNDKLMYAFRYWDISKEALMLVLESLCEGMHI